MRKGIAVIGSAAALVALCAARAAAHDCVGGVDCLETAGYNAGIAILGGFMAGGAALLSGGLGFDPSATPDDVLGGGSDVPSSDEPPDVPPEPEDRTTSPGPPDGPLGDPDQ